jgi:hypothetical protein
VYIRGRSTLNNEPNQPSATNHPVRKTLALSILALALSAGLILYGQRVVDAVMARVYRPSSQVAAVHDRLNMTHLGADLFYASNPKIQQQDEFNNNCDTEERTTAILGCYYRRNIYLFDIKNKDLDGTLDVTAAHEMLHAAYDRLNFFERGYVDQMIKAEYETLKNDAALRQIMAYYTKTEPGAELNELHSILGTTVAKLSPQLESYYSQYFNNRASVVALNEKYNSVFDGITKQSAVLKSRLTALRGPIDDELAQYEADRKQLELDIASFNERASSGGFTTQSSFNAVRGALIARVEAINQRRAAVNARVADYNGIVEQLNALAVRAGTLNSSINGARATTGL